jgi:hypothetical protein
MHIVRMGSSGFSATLTRARTIPSVNGTLLSEISEEMSTTEWVEPFRTCP